jgi:hypothetical protein
LPPPKQKPVDGGGGVERDLVGFRLRDVGLPVEVAVALLAVADPGGAPEVVVRNGDRAVLGEVDG